MKINKSSWHYRLLNKMDLLSNYRESLCPYFWKVVFAVVVAPVIALLVLGVATIPFWWSFSVKVPLSVAILIGVAEIAFLLFILKSVIDIRHDEEILAGTREAPVEVIREEKPPSLFRLWLTAKHRQVCPLIDFVTDDNNLQ